MHACALSHEHACIPVIAQGYLTRLQALGGRTGKVEGRVEAMTARSEHEAQASEGTASYRLAGVVYKGEAEPSQGKLCKQGWLATMSRASYP